MNSLKQKMKMQQKLTPQQLLLMRLLQLPVTSLEQRLKEEIEKNPLLEVDDESNAEHIDNSDMHDNDNCDGDGGGDFHDIDMDEYFDDDDYSYRERMEKDNNVADKHFDISDNVSFADLLMKQLDLQNLSQRDRTIGTEIIGCIDASGYLGRDTALIANDLAFRSGIDADESEIDAMLLIIQSFDPAGVGARSLQECLSLQLHRMPHDDSVAMATTIVDKHFSLLSNKKYDQLAAILKTDDQHLNDAIATIQRLNPKPGWGREAEHQTSAYIIPDFIVSRDGGQLSFMLNDRSVPRLRVCNDYTEMMHSLDSRKQLTTSEKETLSFIKNRYGDAQWLIDTLGQRQQTLVATMEAILSHQQTFFLSGNRSDLKPMKLTDIAKATGFDESTVSRVVSQKYVQTDFGTFPLKETFSKSLTKDDGETVTVDNIREHLLSIIDNEDKKHPLTDEQISAALVEKGFPVSRRTVTKYREKMNIPVGRLRKEL